MKKLTNNSFDEKLSKCNNKVTRIGDYKGSKTKTLFRCNECNYTWETRPDMILLSKHGCPFCTNEIPLTNKIIDQRIPNKHIKRIGNYIKDKVKIDFECLDCGHIWKTRPDVVMRGHKCPKCAVEKNRLSNEETDKRLSGRNISRISKYSGNILDKIIWKCHECDFIWESDTNNVVNGKKGCPNCIHKRERFVYSTLVEIGFNNIQRQKYFIINGTKRFIDFYIKHRNVDYAIEYNGIQHYEPVEFFGGNTRFIEQKNRDNEVRSYFRKKDINMIEIKYDLTDNEIYEMLNNIFEIGE